MPTHKDISCRFWRKFPRAGLVGLLISVALVLASGCARTPTAGMELPPLFFPLPPLPPRVQYLGSISSPLDLPNQQSSFADFVLGPKRPRHPLVKPNNIILVGSQLYICDTILNTVIVYDLSTGKTHRLAGDRGMGKIKQPNNIEVDEAGRLLVADKLRGAVLVYSPDERFLHAWGRPGEVQPVAVVAGSEKLYVCDIKDHEVEVWDSSDGSLLRTIGEHGEGPGQFALPTYLALDAEGNLYVTDTGNFRVQKFSPAGEWLMEFGGLGVALGRFAWPKGMDVDSRGRIYVTDSRFANVQIFDKTARLLLFFGGPGPERGNLDLPAGLRVYPWPDIPWLTKRIAENFLPEFLVIVVSQKGAGFINFFAVAREAEQVP